MAREELDERANALLKEKNLLEERLGGTEKLSFDERQDIYASLRRISEIISSIEKTLQQMGVDDVMDFLKECINALNSDTD